MILGGRTLPELHVSAFIAVSQCCEVVCKRKKKASTRQDDIINALPDLHDTNGNTIPKMVEYGSYTTSATSASRAPHARLPMRHGFQSRASRKHPCAVPRLCRCEHTSGQ